MATISLSIGSEGRLKAEQIMNTSPTATPINTAISSPVEKAFANDNSIFSSGRRSTRKVVPLKFKPTDFPEATVKEKYWHLAAYFSISLALTFYNKIIMGEFPYPYLLTAVHTASTSIGCQILLQQNFFKASKLSITKYFVLVAFSVLYTLNIALSNVSLNLVTIPFHQCMRASTPIFAIIINVILFSHTYGKMAYISLLPIIFGVALATFGDYYYTKAGLLVTLLGTLFAAAKTVATNRIQTGYSLHLNALEILYHMSPLAFIQSLIYAYISGELYHIFKSESESQFTVSSGVIILINGILAFVLNWVSFTANKKTGALTMTVAANIKQALTIMMGAIFFHLQMGWLNVTGIILTLIGGAWYAKTELEAKSLRA